MEIAHPFRIDRRGRTASSDPETHVRDLIEQVLFTMPGERVNRPDFGCGLMQLIFAPSSDELTAATQFLVQSQLHQWLGDQILVEEVTAERDESTLNVAVQYTVRRSQERQVARFSREV